MWISRGKHVLSDLVKHGQNWWIWTREIPVVVITGFDWHLCNVFPVAKLKDKWFICIRSAMYCFRRTREFHVESTFYQTLWNMVKTGGFQHVKFPWWTESNTRVHKPCPLSTCFSSEKHVSFVNSLFGSTWWKTGENEHRKITWKTRVWNSPPVGHVFFTSQCLLGHDNGHATALGDNLIEYNNSTTSIE